MNRLLSLLVVFVATLAVADGLRALTPNFHRVVQFPRYACVAYYDREDRSLSLHLKIWSFCRRHQLNIEYHVPYLQDGPVRLLFAVRTVLPRSNQPTF